MTLHKQRRLFDSRSLKAVVAPEKLIGERRIQYIRETLRSFLVPEQCVPEHPPVIVHRPKRRSSR